MAALMVYPSKVSHASTLVTKVGQPLLLPFPGSKMTLTVLIEKNATP